MIASLLASCDSLAALPASVHAVILSATRAAIIRAVGLGEWERSRAVRTSGLLTGSALGLHRLGFLLAFDLSYKRPGLQAQRS